MATGGHYFAGDIEPEYRAFVAIDLGTTFSACAFAIGKESSEIHLASKKIPTALLLHPSTQLTAFGEKAISDYFDLEDDEAEDWYYFDRFKMSLHKDESVNSLMDLQSHNGKTLPAKIVFGRALQYFREMAIKSISDSTGMEFVEGEIKWILTVPAIWGDRAKGFMTAAAAEAGMSPDAVDLALEPEGAAFCCRNDLHHAHKALGKPKVLRYVVADCGGGTIDVAVHDLDVLSEAKKIKEVHRATGGDWGGTMVDAKICQLVRKIIGEDVASKIDDTEWLRFTRQSIEEAKRSVKPGANKIKLSFTNEMLTAIRSAGGDINEAVLRFSGVWYRRSAGALLIDEHLMKDCFEESLKRIAKHVGDILTEVGGVHCILVVGGYAECDLLIQHMEEEFQTPERKVVCPTKPSVAVVTGAVVHGQSPNIMESRVMKATYGVKIVEDFQPGKHKEEKMQLLSGRMVCPDVFEKYVAINESVPVDFSKEKTFHPLYPTQTHMTARLYSSPSPNPMYVDDEGCKLLGYLTVHSPNIEKGTDRELLVGIKFSGTMLKFNAVDITSGSTARLTLTFHLA